MNKTDEILDRLKGMQPVIDNPDELTDSIMNALPEQTDGKTATKVRMWPYIVSFVAAAGLLLLLSMGFHKNVATEPATLAQKETVRQVETPANVLRDTIKVVEKLVLARNVKAKQTTEAPEPDSLEYYIEKLEKELQQVSDRCYLARVEAVIQEDEQLCRAVNELLYTGRDTSLLVANEVIF